MRKALVFLGILNDSDLDWMVATGTRREVPRGHVLIEEGKPIDSVYVVLDGALSVSVRGARNREVARLLSGEIVGEISFVDSRPPSATVQALENSLVLAIARASLQSRLENDPAFAARFYRALAVLLADRMRSTLGALGYGTGPRAAEDSYAGEIDPDTLDQTSLAGARFDLLRRRLRTI